MRSRSKWCFDPARLSYEGLLDYFFRMHDPTTLNRQHNDVGTQYRSAIFFTSEAQTAHRRERQGALGQIGQVQQTYHDRDHPRDQILPRRGLPPKVPGKTSRRLYLPRLAGLIRGAQFPAPIGGCLNPPRRKGHCPG